jgi:flavin-dependent dehydrogenase
MIRIAGLGISGLYLYWRLKNDGFDVSGYDIKKDDFYIPCGYATNENIMKGYMDVIGVDFQKYVLSRAKNITFSGNNFQEKHLESSGLCTFDKNQLEKDESNNLKILPIDKQNKDMIVDATGITRAYLGKSKNDRQYYSLEYLTDQSDHRDFYFYFFKGGRGYFWSFPLGNKYHVGAGSLSIADLNTVRKSIPLKITSRNIRMVPLFDSMSRENIIGIGEAIGTVSPITGEGIIPSLRSAELLFQCIKKYDKEELLNAYTKAISKEFGYYYKLSRLIFNIRSGKIINPTNIYAIKYVKRTVNDFGIKLDILPFLKHFI